METDYAVSLGEFLRDWLDEYDLTEQQLADNLNAPVDLVHDLLEGGELASCMAQALTAVTGCPADWWLKIEAQYQADRTRIVPEG